MKKIIAVVVLGLLAAGSAHALDINGFLKTDWRVKADSTAALTWNENVVNLKLKSAVASGASGFAELELKNTGFPTAGNLNDLSLYDKSKAAPWTLELKEGYVDISNLFVEGFDLRAGKQRITWGTADRFNPTDNLNPLDLSDLTDFGRRVANTSLKATYYIGNFYAQGVFIPVFTPGVLPANWMSMYPMPLMAGVTIRNMDLTVTMPEDRLESSSFAVKLGGKVFGFDISLSYFRGYDGLPLDRSRTVTMVDTAPTVDVAVGLNYPKMQVIGFDLAGSIFDAGIWFELGYCIPDQFDTTAFNPFVPPFTTTGTKLLEPWLKYTVGTDYTFPVVGIYINAQYCHGFFDEYTSSDSRSKIRDYLVAQMDKKFFDDKLKLALAGFIEMDYAAGAEHFVKSWTIVPEITYCPFEATEIVLGAYMLDSWAGGKFESSKDSDEVYLKIKYSY